ncbi:MAG TPA: hypothetical protein VK145_00945 [Candidatus Nanoarchaeia archaeon]|nr:hypothetical protein [Candidatus Nanoarchaeia archaeon]
MDFHDKEFFDRLMALTEENNRMLKRIRRAAFWNGLIRIVYWLIILGISIGAYYYVQPYLEQLITTYKAVQTGTAQIQGFVNPFSR